MAKAKSKKAVSVALNEAYVCECPECFDTYLIRDVARDGDTITCDSCGQRMKVDGIYSDVRRDGSSRELNITRVPF